MNSALETPHWMWSYLYPTHHAQPNPPCCAFMDEKSQAHVFVEGIQILHGEKSFDSLRIGFNISTVEVEPKLCEWTAMNLIIHSYWIQIINSGDSFFRNG